MIQNLKEEKKESYCVRSGGQGWGQGGFEGINDSVLFCNKFLKLKYSLYFNLIASLCCIYKISPQEYMHL